MIQIKLQINPMIANPPCFRMILDLLVRLPYSAAKMTNLIKSEGKGSQKSDIFRTFAQIIRIV